MALDMEITGVTVKSEGVWGLWLYLLGVVAVTGSVTQGALVLDWHGVVAVASGIVSGVGWGVVAWVALRFLVRPIKTWNIGLANGHNLVLKVAVHLEAGEYEISIDGAEVLSGRSIRLLAETPTTLDVPGHDFKVRLRPSLWSTIKLSVDIGGARTKEF